MHAAAQPARGRFGRDFWLLALSNGFFFAGFHGLLPTVPLRALALGGGPTEVGLVAGIFVLSSLLVRGFADSMERRWGDRRCLVAGILIAGGSALLYPAAQTVGALLAVRIVSGAGFGVGTTFFISAVMRLIPPERRGEGMGYFGLATTVAMGVAPAGALWIMSSWGYLPMFVLAAACEGLALVGLAFCRLPPAPAPIDLPAGQAMAKDLAARLVEPGTRTAALMIVLFGCAYGVVLNFVAVYARTVGLDLAGLFFVVATVFIFAARFVAGRVYDRFGVAWAAAPGGVLLALGLILLAKATTPAPFLVAAMLFGAGVGVLYPALQTETLIAVAPPRRAAASATFSNALDLGLGGGSVLLGMLAQRRGLPDAFLVAAAALLAMLAVLAARSRSVAPVEAAQTVEPEFTPPGRVPEEASSDGF